MNPKVFQCAELNQPADHILHSRPESLSIIRTYAQCMYIFPCKNVAVLMGPACVLYSNDVTKTDRTVLATEDAMVVVSSLAKPL
jgi:hypothetical protein